MRGPLSLPQGRLLKALGIRNSPTQIDGLNDTAVAIIDMMPWLTDANAKYIIANQSLQVAGIGYLSGGTNLGPDSKHLWLVEWCSVQAFVVQTQLLRYKVGKIAPNGTARHAVGVSAMASLTDAVLAANATASVVAFNDRPFFLHGETNDQIGACIERYDNGGLGDVTLTIDAKVFEFEI